VTVAALAVFGLMGLVWNTNQVTLMQERAPAAMLGRISAAFQTPAIGGTPWAHCWAGRWRPPGTERPALLVAGLFSLSGASLLPQIN
jgi:hypothetical protein